MIGGFTMKHKLKDPGSAITHLIGMILAAIVSIPLIIKSFLSGDYVRIISLIIFTISMIGLYGASTAYHSFNISPMINKKLKKLDHAMIFVLIAGSYTPICTIVLGGTLGYGLLSVIWIIAILGIVFKMFWVTCPKWVSSVMYIAMGWLCIVAIAPIIPPNKTFEELLERKKLKYGLEGEEAYKAIVASSMKANPKVNKMFGLE